MNMKKYLSLFFIFFFGSAVLFFPLSFIFAADSIFTSDTFMEANGIDADCVNKGNCTPCDFLLMGIRITRWILGISGAIALILFVIAGFLLLVSAGNKTMIDRAKAIIKGTVIGLILLFASWQLINLLLNIFMTKTPPGSNAAIPSFIKGNTWTTIECKRY